jgi:hypothetical protein
MCLNYEYEHEYGPQELSIMLTLLEYTLEWSQLVYPTRNQTKSLHLLSIPRKLQVTRCIFNEKKESRSRACFSFHLYQSRRKWMRTWFGCDSRSWWYWRVWKYSESAECDLNHCLNRLKLFETSWYPKYAIDTDMRASRIRDLELQFIGWWWSSFR